MKMGSGKNLKSLTDFSKFGEMQLNMIASNPKDPQDEKCIENPLVSSDNDLNKFTRHG